MSALPDSLGARQGDQLPEYLPARMVNEFVYCPRLFFYEWVEGVFAHSADTLEGQWEHRRVDQPAGTLDPEAEQERVRARAVTLTSERLRVIAKLDVVDGEGGVVTPIDYKHGAPREMESGALEAWDPDRVQVALQGILLREAGWECREVVLYYQKTKQRVRIPLDAAVVREAESAVQRAWETARAGALPAPLRGSSKCQGCSLAGICLPDETNLLSEQAESSEQLPLFGKVEPRRKPPGSEGIRRLQAPREERKPLYLNTPGLRVGRSGEVLQVRERERLVQEMRIHEIHQVNLYGNVQMTTQAIQALLENGVPVSYFSTGGWYYGITTGMNSKNVFLRRSQYRLAEERWFCLKLARELVEAKIRNQRVMLQRNHVEPRREWLVAMKQMAGQAKRASSLEELLGVEGNAARVYFGAFRGMIKLEGAEAGEEWFDFAQRNRRPPRDPVNALLSLAYSVLAKDLSIACYAVGFDPLLGFYHQPRFGRPSLALDLMEPFRPLIADSVVLTVLNTEMVNERSFVRTGQSVALTAEGRKAFFRAYENRMDTLVTHPLFDYRVSYRRLLEIQARLLGRVLGGEIGTYPAFVTR